MREILFRGKLLAGTSAGEWVYGNLDVKSGGRIAIITPDDTPLGKYGRVDPSTVGEYTGLKDATGKLIFEGDIVANYDPEESRAEAVGVPVVWHDAGFCTEYPGDAPPLYHVLERRDCEYLAVIGNVHDTPSLLTA